MRMKEHSHCSTCLLHIQRKEDYSDYLLVHSPGATKKIKNWIALSIEVISKSLTFNLHGGWDWWFEIGIWESQNWTCRTWYRTQRGQYRGRYNLVESFCGSAFFTCVLTQWRDSLLFGEKLVLEKLELPLILFYFKRGNKIRKKTLNKWLHSLGKTSLEKTRVLVRGSGYLLGRYL